MARRTLALTAAAFAVALSTAPLTSASAICELPTGQTCPNPCPSAARTYDDLARKYPLPERPFLCWT